ncbi:MAG: DUF5668 domain-containing protein [Roseivirga sp.]
MNNLNRSATIGLVFLVIGSFMILNNLGIIPWRLRQYIFQWENILILIGAVLVISRQNIKVGVVLLALGAFFSFDHWFNIYVSIFDLWPLVFVVAGLYIINRSRDNKSFSPGDQAFSSDIIDDTAIFGGGDRVISTANFQGGNLTAIFGGSNIDLTSSQLAEGENVVDVFYMFGGSKIRVPQDWNVHLNVTGIFGGMSDKRTLVDPDKYATKTLYIKGIALFGGAELTN